MSLVPGNKSVDFNDCNSFCLIVKNNRMFNNLLDCRVKTIFGIIINSWNTALIKTSIQEEGDLSEEELMEDFIA